MRLITAFRSEEACTFALELQRGDTVTLDAACSGGVSGIYAAVRKNGLDPAPITETSAERLRFSFTTDGPEAEHKYEVLLGLKTPPLDRRAKKAPIYFLESVLLSVLRANARTPIPEVYRAYLYGGAENGTLALRFRNVKTGRDL